MRDLPGTSGVDRRVGGRHRLAWGAAAAGLLAIGMLWMLRPAPRHGGPGGGRFANGGPPSVGVAAARVADLPETLNELGTVMPLATVTVQTQISGQLVEVGFREGQEVRKGDFLAQIDPRPYQLQLEQSQGQLAKDRSLLNNARLDLKRYQTLVEQDSIARQQLDTQAALVKQDEGAVVSDQAQIDTARLDLLYCHLVAPVGGRVGLRQIDPGNYVTPNEPNGIVVLTQMRPIDVEFTVAEDDLPRVFARARDGGVLQATAFDRSGNIKLATGRLVTIDNQIDTSTGMVKLKAEFDNADEALFPNQFVNIRLLVDTLKGATVVPSAALQQGALGAFVYLVLPDHTVTARAVTPGLATGTDVAVTKGLQPGDIVVTDGVDHLREGTKVTIAAQNDVPAGPADQPPPPHSGHRHHHDRGSDAKSDPGSQSGP